MGYQIPLTIYLTSSGIDSGPFDLYVDIDNYTTPIITGISRSSLISGYYITTLDDTVNYIKLISTGICVQEYTLQLFH